MRPPPNAVWVKLCGGGGAAGSLKAGFSSALALRFLGLAKAGFSSALALRFLGLASTLNPKP